MIDVVAGTYDALARGSIGGIPVAFAAGIVTSVGPCVAPRYLALAAVLRGRDARLAIIATFVGGLVGAYLVLGYAAGMLGTLSAQSGPLYIAFAVGLAGWAIVTLVREPQAACRRAHVSGHTSGTFLLGASSALVVSPCCTPIIGALAGFATLERAPLAGSLLLGAYALGHAAPLIGAALIGDRLSRPLRRAFPPQAASIVSATLLFALAGWYLCLA